MSREWTPPDDKTIAKMKAIMRTDLEKGTTPEEIIDALVTSDGWPEAEAAELLASVALAKISDAHAALLDALGERPTVAGLVAEGLSVDAAEEVLDRCQALRSARQNKYALRMLFGGLLAGGGALVTLATYYSAQEGGGTYIIAWGAMIGGAVMFLYGLFGTLFRR